MNTSTTILKRIPDLALSIFLFLLAANVGATGKANVSDDGPAINPQLLVTAGICSDSTKSKVDVIDREPPVFTIIPRNGIATSFDEVAFNMVMAVDNSSAVDIMHADVVDGHLNSGIVTRTWTATDQSGNSSTVSATVRYYGTGLAESEMNQMELSQPEKAKQTGEFALYQNFPNPFAKNTVIPFYLPKADTVTLKVYGASGRVLHTSTGNFGQGDNKLNLNGSDLKIEGILYYELITSKLKRSRKMLFKSNK